MQVVRSQLEANDHALRSLLHVFKGGADITAAMQSVSTYDGVMNTDAAVQALYESRHRLRKTALAAALRTGMTIGDAAVAFGIPPDNVAGYTSETAR